MSEIEIPAEFVEAYRVAMILGEYNAEPDVLADALVWAVAGWMRSEWEREHKAELGCLWCDDPRHAWTTLEQWMPEARELLEGKR